MKVLSLYDGMSCGYIALRECGLEPAEYTAYEMDKHAIKVSSHNFPIIEHRGEIFPDTDFTEFEGVDFVMGGSPCFAAGTMVYTSEGHKPIEELQVGDEVLTHKNRFRKVTAVGGKMAEAYELIATGFMPTTTTANHPYYTRDKIKVYSPSTRGMIKGLTEPTFKRVDALESKISHLGMNQLQVENDWDIDNKDLWLLGRYVADGHNRISKRKHRKHSCQYQLVISVGNSKLDAFKEEMTHRHFSCYPHSQSVHRCVFSSEHLCRMVERMGFGTSAKTKTIPTKVLNLPKDKLKIFLEGYFSGDGHITDRGIFCTTVSKKLALTLSMAILKVYGVSANVTTTTPSPTRVLCGRVVNQSKLYLVSFKYKPSFATAGRMIDSQMWTPLRAVTPKGEAMVYNISVEEDESYTANNAIVHNCTHWSIAQSPDKRETTASGLGWELFQHYVRAVEQAKPKYFIYENNKSMSKEIRRSIDEAFGFEATLINSARVSAQNRNRLYWVGKRNALGEYDRVKVSQPEDLGILVKDILDGGFSMQDKSYALTTLCNGAIISDTLSKKRHTMIAAPICVNAQSGDRYGKRTQPSVYDRIYSDEGKAPAVHTGHKPSVAEPVCLRPERTEQGKLLRKDYEAGVIEHGYSEHKELQPRTDGKTNTITTVTKDNYVAEPLIVPEATTRGYVEIEEGECVDLSQENSKTRRGRKMSEKSNCLTTSNHFYQYVGTTKVYEVKDGRITLTIKGEPRTYDIKLKDGYYIIRKLSVSECARLQTVPDWYDFSPISATQAYRALGNGWTIRVIQHLIEACMRGEVYAKRAIQQTLF